MKASVDEPAHERPRRVVGLMSGTSMDGIDVAVLDTDGESVVEFGPHTTSPYDPELRARLARAVGDPDALDGSARDTLAQAIADAHAEAVREFMAAEADATRGTALIGFHGHTLVHRPEAGLSLQLGDAARLASTLGIPVVAELRLADLRAGGQGAPLAPVFHRALAQSLDGPLAVLNLGGVGNVSWISDERIVAFDTGPGNALLDDWVGRHTGEPCDRDGRHAAAGCVDAAVLARLMAHDYFIAPAPKSLDRSAFSLQPLDTAALTFVDGAATLTAFTAASVAAALAHLPQAPLRWLVTGGGRHNPTLMRALAARLDAPVEPVEAVGWAGDAIEAQAFAFLAMRSLRGLPLTYPSTTGVAAPTTGGRYFDPR